MGAASGVLVMVGLRRLGTGACDHRRVVLRRFYSAVHSQPHYGARGPLDSAAVDFRRRAVGSAVALAVHPVLMAGVLLGIAAATKIWGVAGVVAVAFYALNHLQVM